MLLLLLRGEAFHRFEGGLVEGFAHRFRDAETQVDLLDVVCRHFLLLLLPFGGDGEVEGAEVAQLHRVAVEQQALHHLLQLIDCHFGFLWIQRRLVGQHLGHIVLVHLADAFQHRIPFACPLWVARVHSLNSVEKDCHNLLLSFVL